MQIGKLKLRWTQNRQKRLNKENKKETVKEKTTLLDEGVGGGAKETATELEQVKNWKGLVSPTCIIYICVKERLKQQDSCKCKQH